MKKEFGLVELTASRVDFFKLISQAASTALCQPVCVVFTLLLCLNFSKTILSVEEQTNDIRSLCWVSGQVSKHPAQPGVSKILHAHTLVTEAFGKTAFSL